jgi:hypothetical protein
MMRGGLQFFETSKSSDSTYLIAYLCAPHHKSHNLVKNFIKQKEIYEKKITIIHKTYTSHIKTYIIMLWFS